MPEDFVIARNPDPDSTLPYLVRLPLGPMPVVLKVKDTWPRTAKVYCHPADGWPDEPDIVERVPTRDCLRRGAAIDLVIEILVDSHEQYPWRFSGQQATTKRAGLEAGDYAVEVDGRVVATVERKSLADLAATATNGKLRSLMAALAAMPRAAVVVEERWSSVFKLQHVRPAVVADALAEAQVRFPNVPIVFCETRPLAQEWTYRFLGAAVAHAGEDEVATVRAAALPLAGPLPARPPTTAEIRAWANAAGLEVSDRGRLRPEVVAAWNAAHPG